MHEQKATLTRLEENGFFLDIYETEKEFEFWIRHKDCDIADYVFGAPKEGDGVTLPDLTLEEFKKRVIAQADKSMKEYTEKHMRKEETEDRPFLFSELDPDVKKCIEGCEEEMEELISKGPELGNLLFGHSWGEHPLIPRVDFEDTFCAFLDELGCDTYGYPKTNKSEDMFCAFLDELGCDTCGYPKTDKNSKSILPDGCVENLVGNSYGFGNDVFEIRPYYWGEGDEADLPNFVYKPTKLEIRWYKYPMRDAYSSQYITPNNLELICKKCLESVQSGTGTKNAEKNKK